jgi:hypothetical protein
VIENVSADNIYDGVYRHQYNASSHYEFFQLGNLGVNRIKHASYQ